MSRSLDAARRFLDSLAARGGREGTVLAGEFSDIRAHSASWKTDLACSTEAGSRPENVSKNRYKDVLPYDQTRVTLSLLQEEGHGDYINGNFIRGTDGRQAYIATQGPLPHTLLDFWRLVWEYGVKVILMACREVENGRKKCERYWAQAQEPLQVGGFCINLTEETWLNVDIMLRTLQVTFQKESRRVHQLQFVSWPDRGVPSQPEHVLAMVEKARCLQGSDPAPLCIHCRFRKQTIPPNFSLFEVVLEMRRQRPAVVQTEEQYRFLHQAVTQLFDAALQEASPRYQNLQVNCAPHYEDISSLHTSPALLRAPDLPGGVLRSVSAPRTPGPAMADTYAVVQKRGSVGGTRARGGGDGDVDALYSRVARRARDPQAPAEDPPGAPPGRAASTQSLAAGGTYEDVSGGVHPGNLGFNVRIGKPKGPRDPPAEWTRM
ncbi:tyrosine-protein phosphatase non-receptor type 18 isoform X2 [Sorex araneus]|uniref:tyrosine-protein phosphatase non-receptor type 18 isoform X2 n=1 Tax=Sorex araneus TaxID=42254 RepID=UPI002433E5C4|nr:tyrosine-protein phosphatase non-receptor type 18 isoform X2 [Sorex araneus]